MELQTEAITRLELKYCEQCGGLWLRVMGATGSYCPGCERGMSQLPRRAADNRRTGGSGPRKRALQRAALRSPVRRAISLTRGQYERGRDGRLHAPLGAGSGRRARLLCRNSEKVRSRRRSPTVGLSRPDFGPAAALFPALSPGREATVGPGRRLFSLKSQFSAKLHI